MENRTQDQLSVNDHNNPRFSMRVNEIKYGKFGDKYEIYAKIGADTYLFTFTEKEMPNIEGIVSRFAVKPNEELNFTWEGYQAFVKACKNMGLNKL